jgi:hypothetical protein
MNLGRQLKSLRVTAGLRYRDLNIHHNVIRNIENDRGYTKESLNKYVAELEQLSGYPVEFIVRWGKKKNKQAPGEDNST